MAEKKNKPGYLYITTSHDLFLYLVPTFEYLVNEGYSVDIRIHGEPPNPPPNPPK